MLTVFISPYDALPIYNAVSLIAEKPSTPVIKNKAKELENGKLTRVSDCLYTVPLRPRTSPAAVIACRRQCLLQYTNSVPVLTMCRAKAPAFVFITQHVSPVVSTLTHTCCYHSQRRLKDGANDRDISECGAYTPDLSSARAIVTHGYAGNRHFFIV